jgi:DNA-binding MarR family transcriptional regulator
MMDIKQWAQNNLGLLLAKASQRWNELLYERFNEAGYGHVTAAYGAILTPLFVEDGLRMNELAQRTRLSKQTMTTLIKLMEKNGLVTRERDPDDGRAFRIYLTEEARDFRDIAFDAFVEMEGLTESVLNPQEITDMKVWLSLLMDMQPDANPQPIKEDNMRSNTQTVTINRNARDVFAFLSQPENLPQWALPFCKRIEPVEGEWWIVTSPTEGVPDRRLRFVTDASAGVIDMYISPREGVEVLVPTRVVANGDSAEYIFTQFQLPNQPDETFQAQVAGMAIEFAAIKRVLEG